jgi:membrane protein implicated in regulation of membrane protease activity
MNFRPTGLELIAAIVFAAVAIWLLRKLRAGDVVDRTLIGKTGDVTKLIERGHPGRIWIEGREWVARSGEQIAVGSFGEVVAIDGSSVTVIQVPALSSHTTGYHMMEM